MTADWWVRTCNCFDTAIEDSGDNYAQSSETDQTPETLAGDESKGPVYRACHVHRRLDSGSHVSGREPEKTAGSTSELQTGQRCADQRQATDKCHSHLSQCKSAATSQGPPSKRRTSGWWWVLVGLCSVSNEGYITARGREWAGNGCTQMHKERDGLGYQLSGLCPDVLPTMQKITHTSQNGCYVGYIDKLYIFGGQARQTLITDCFVVSPPFKKN